MPEGLHPSTHPPLPPTTEDDRVLWLRLLRSRRVGIAIFSVFCLNMAALPLRLTPSPKLPALQVWSATKPSVKKLHAPSFPVVLTPAQRSSATARLNTP